MTTINNCEVCIRLRNSRGITRPEKMNLPYCNKCREINKATIRKNKINELKENVKADPKLLIRTDTDFWSENAIKTAVDLDNSIALEVYQMYPKSKCYILHNEDKKKSIMEFLQKHFDRISSDNKKVIVNVNNSNKVIDIPRDNKAIQKNHILELSRQIPEWACYPGIAYFNTYKPQTWALDYNDFLDLVSQEPGALEFVPEKMRTYELCLIAMKCASKAAIENYHINGEGFPLIHVPMQHRTVEMCLAAASWCNRALWFFPRELRTLDMYIECAKLNPSTIHTTMPVPFCNNPEVIKAAQKIDF